MAWQFQHALVIVMSDMTVKIIPVLAGELARPISEAPDINSIENTQEETSTQLEEG